MPNPRAEAPPLPNWLASELPFDRSSVRLGDQTMHVMEQGRPGDPCVLLVHGNPTWGYLYRRVARGLADAKLHVVMPDLIGLGLSSKPREAGAHTLDAHARWLGELIDALELDEVTLVVQDWGGPIGTLAMADRAPRLHGMVVLNTVLSPPKENFKPTAFHRFARMPVVSDLAFRGLGFPQVRLSMAQGDPDSIAGKVSRAYRWPLRRLRDRAAPLAMARMVPDSHDHPSVAGLRHVQAFVEAWRGPTEIVWGDKDPVLGSVRNWISKLLPHAPVTRTSAGHFLQEEVPHTIAEAIRRVVAARPTAES